jgi:hypothetical protein
MKHELGSFFSFCRLGIDLEGLKTDSRDFLFFFQPSKHEVLLSSPTYIHKIHGTTKLESKDGSEGCPTPTKELWSVAKLSLECNNNAKDDTRTSFYQQLNQMQQRSFHHHHLDVSHS